MPTIDPLGPRRRAHCAVGECQDEATGFYRIDGATIVIMVGRPRSKDEIPLCTRHTWALSRDMLAPQPA